MTYYTVLSIVLAWLAMYPLSRWYSWYRYRRPSAIARARTDWFALPDDTPPIIGVDTAREPSFSVLEMAFFPRQASLSHENARQEIRYQQGLAALSLANQANEERYWAQLRALQGMPISHSIDLRQAAQPNYGLGSILNGLPPFGWWW